MEQSSNKKHIEAEIAALEAKLAEKRQILGSQEIVPAKEDVREAVRERMARVSVSPAIKLSPEQGIAVPTAGQITKTDLEGQPPDRQVIALVNLALEHSIDHAVKLAVNLNDPFIYDSLHDQLTTVFYEELIKRNKLQV